MTNSEKRKAKADLDRSIAENSKRNREAAARNAEAKANADLSDSVNVDTGFVREEALKARLDDGTEVPIKMFAAHHRGAVKMFQKKTLNPYAGRLQMYSNTKTKVDFWLK